MFKYFLAFKGMCKMSAYIFTSSLAVCSRAILTLRKLMSTIVDILSFYKHLYNQFLKVK